MKEVNDMYLISKTIGASFVHMRGLDKWLHNL